MAIEFELKYQANTDALERIRDAFPGGYTRIPMMTTYYDTPDGSLSARHWTLRHRQEGDRHVCALKTPASGGARGEWETDSARITDALETLEKMSGLLLPRELVPLCGARFDRETVLLQPEGCSAELALDNGVLLGGGRTEAFCEVELELRSGSREALEEFGELFSRRFALTSQPKSKFARAKTLGQEG